MDRTAMGMGGGGPRPSMAPPSHQQQQQQPGGVVKARQLSHLHAQLAQLSANLADTENLLRMTSVQAEAMRGLGSWHGGMFMAASKVLGEESVKEQGGGK
ncbi:DASH complex subunit Hsk3 like-domain-containing protein [Biscogniauxia sp. FL1348]|nr:DASH complex subunit Hsk3 like-domain-containing protein [Biscogniauxia sp. FL1348]